MPLDELGNLGERVAGVGLSSAPQQGTVWGGRMLTVLIPRWAGAGLQGSPETPLWGYGKMPSESWESRS